MEKMPVQTFLYFIHFAKEKMTGYYSTVNECVL